MRKRRIRPQDADLDITSFMNLMIILVPVLLMSMVFSHITVLDLKLPDLNSSSAPSDDKPKKDETLELIVLPEELIINFPKGNPVHRIAKIKNPETNDLDYNYKELSTALQDVKKQLRLRGIDKKDIFLLSQQNTDYQTIVKLMDAARSYKAVQVTSVVDAVLFPNISLGDAPESNLKPAKPKGAK